MTQANADVQLSHLLAGVNVLFDAPAVVDEVRRLVVAHSVVGKKIHDTRLVATMTQHGVKELLTFNDADFKRFSDITVLQPKEVAEKKLPLI